MTSSVNLRRTPDATEHLGSVCDALVDVAENSFFAFVEPVDAGRFSELATAVPAWIEALLVFEGAFGGALRVAVPEPLALELFASFLGLEPGEVPDDVRLFDMVGELGNMVCGAWLTRNCHRRRFDLQHPDVKRVVERPDAEHALRVAINGQPAWLHLRFIQA